MTFGETQTTDPPVTTKPLDGDTPVGSGTGVSDTFEGTGSSWTGRGDVNVLLTSSYKHGGSKSMACTGRTDSWNGLSCASSELKAGGSYTFDSYVSYDNSAYPSHGFTFGVQYDDSTGTTQYDNIGNATVSSGKWSLLSGDFTIPSGASNISLYVQTEYTESATAEDLIDFYLDDVTLTSSGSITPPVTTPGTTTPGSGTTGNQNSKYLKEAFGDFFRIGTSVSPNELSSGGDFIKKHFNSITPENELKPDSTLNQQASQQMGNNVNPQVSLSYGAKQTLKFCEDNNIALRGHTLVWYSQTPDWLFRENFSNNGSYVSKDIMDQRLENYIKNVMNAIATEFPKLNVYAWDVCNELFVNDGGGLRPADNSNWTRIYGDDSFVMKAFTYARKYAPKGCKLFLNDYNEYIPAKTNDIYNLAMKLKEAGVIDGIGMQSHLDVSYPSAQVYKTALEKFLSTGLEVQVTELDITCGDASAQAKLFADIFQLCVDHASQIGAVTVWGTHDSISWRSSQNPLLFGANYSEKQAYKSVLEVAQKATPATTTTTTPKVTTVTTTTTPKTTTPATTTTKLQQNLKGDVDCNGTVNATDVVKIIQAMLGKITLSSEGLANADINADNRLSIIDVIKIKNMLL
ncbi:MAG: endo-1,4-beta-xylanase [Oscillospiraceae bacterium]|nr:endo-1,4-beta-xylanase [Oscillospiraceae bacterium]